jgi:amino acid transporter
MKKFLMNNIISLSIILFLAVYFFINYLKPSFLYLDNGSLRDFGLNQKNKTIIPVWLIAFILGIFSYLVTLYYVKVIL